MTTEKLKEAAEKFLNADLKKHDALTPMLTKYPLLYQAILSIMTDFATSPEAAEYHRKEVDVEGLKKRFKPLCKNMSIDPYYEKVEYKYDDVLLEKCVNECIEIVKSLPYLQPTPIVLVKSCDLSDYEKAELEKALKEMHNQPMQIIPAISEDLKAAIDFIIEYARYGVFHNYPLYDSDGSSHQAWYKYYKSVETLTQFKNSKQ